ncbi:protein of unknown function [Bartonella clarridgeiae 73]|uniref:Uncharacterized protein n=1 Tax=Bartonella clarridgeiae (strain CCUG 45776 / CIP 104772 / 73) TaxID=696125 RepID=E6YGC4_BARC7|nr:hypothetical protein [Bartonella clarridgeiae]WCR55481.1 MAG: hypothetical protein PG977_000874 [Bartonella clarridgeiae]CBI75912.1 protein of unknown function [Bartonella clarridgeiae 73]
MVRKGDKEIVQMMQPYDQIDASMVTAYLENWLFKTTIYLSDNIRN